MITKDIELFLTKVIEFAEATDGKEGLIKLETDSGQIEYMKKYLAANQQTWERYLIAPKEARHDINTQIMRTVYDRIKQFQSEHGTDKKINFASA